MPLRRHSYLAFKPIFHSEGACENSNNWQICEVMTSLRHTIFSTGQIDLAGHHLQASGLGEGTVDGESVRYARSRANSANSLNVWDVVSQMAARLPYTGG